MYTKILIAYDRSKGGRLAIDEGFCLAKTLGCQLGVIWVVPPIPYYAISLVIEHEEEEKGEKSFFSEIRKDIQEAENRWGIKVREFYKKYGHPALEIVNCANENGYDLIVLGHSGYSGALGRALGSTAARVSEEARCSVLIARHPPAE
ncbi:universal stress protein [Candidatus Methylacidiphilum fumarolicum]|uniref:Nucleotide-binding protein, UspA family n=2 Tax=Candidatus Methylacidiphilum fumarolicum TaxID=591154 RepID=I0JZH6_METFB|nr:universal stress protein [Candidatus Methylacidiphilum fumarolicum]MBW6415429.1 universal stress protein [Candidatus Methylacidiphilum fumarolicum]TFE69032.1 nucleotide-binding protein, UspA family [Candidatus Methylacidiphilum fumarolicum]TFE74029.1 universal stress protein [Candidatus Methylacidiphilum fumarolicum]TFE74137.1 nucleotide-binding protein, UspA family [Candidatus Methylacidiphilum fumarolicum]TFE74945.1 universal stress protein [Candidatus Methylacidiphilum fumarolicum]